MNKGLETSQDEGLSWKLRSSGFALEQKIRMRAHPRSSRSVLQGFKDVKTQTLRNPMFSPTHFRFTSADGSSIACVRWDSQGTSRGVVQIAHGMGEYIGRYDGLIEALVSDRLTVYGNDHRGHGHTALSPAQFGDFGEGGFDLLVEDMLWLSRIAKHECPFQTYLLFGHSMGSFACSTICARTQR